MTFQELKSRLEAEGFNEQFYCIGDGWNRLSDAHALAVAPGGFEFFYTERGQKSVIEFFVNENEACVFAYNFLQKINGRNLIWSDFSSRKIKPTS